MSKIKDYFLVWQSYLTDNDLLKTEHLIIPNPLPEDLEKNGVYVIEKSAYNKAVAALKKIAGEDYRGNRPSGAVEAYRALKELEEL